MEDQPQHESYNTPGVGAGSQFQPDEIPERDFTIVSNELIRSTELSFRAKGALINMASHREGYPITVELLVSQSKDGKDSVNAAIKELIAAGYVFKGERTRWPQGTKSKSGKDISGAWGPYVYRFTTKAAKAEYWRNQQAKTAGQDQCGNAATAPTRDGTGKFTRTAAGTPQQSTAAGTPQQSASSSPATTEETPGGDHCGNTTAVSPQSKKTREEDQNYKKTNEEMGTDSLRSSVPRADASENPAADGGEDERTNGRNSSQPKTDNTNPGEEAQAEAETVLGIEITEHHRSSATGLMEELTVDPKLHQPADPKLYRAVIENTDMKPSQRRTLEALLPRAFALADNNADKVRGYLYEVGSLARTVTFMLNAFGDELIVNLYDAVELEHVDIRRAKQQEQQAKRAQETENRWNAEGIKIRSRTDTPDLQNAPESSEPVDDDVPEKAQELLNEVGYEPRSLERGVLHSTIRACGFEAVAHAVRTIVDAEGTAALGAVLRSGAKEIAALSAA